jgi:hypothetical protein
LEPIFYVDAIITFVAFKALLNKFTTSVFVENVDEGLLRIQSTVIFLSGYCTKTLEY